MTDELFDHEDSRRKIASMGGKARKDSISPERRKEISQKAIRARWAKARVQKNQLECSNVGAMPIAKYRGFLNILNMQVPCYVLENGQRLIGRTSFTEMLTGIKGGGDLEKYLGVNNLKSFVNLDLVLERMVAFSLPEVEGLEKQVKGLPTDLAIDICEGFVSALSAANQPNSEHKLTPRQSQMAIAAGMFVAACARVGLEALVDEATGYQYDRAENALQVKLSAYLSEEMRKWEKTFPDELWVQFGRLTGWKGSVTKRPKYWGKLVIELVYEYLDKDVAQWLKDNAPEPRKGQNYHQWLSAQYGLKKLLEHIWKLVGISSTCYSISELKRRMAEIHGKVPIQMTLFVDP